MADVIVLNGKSGKPREKIRLHALALTCMSGESCGKPRQDRQRSGKVLRPNAQRPGSARIGPGSAEAEEENWSKINWALAKGKRGLQGNTSLRKLIREMSGASCRVTCLCTSVICMAGTP
jgi:hypothetical protein